MKLLIDIPEHIYEHAKEMTEDSRDEGEAMRAIANGSPTRCKGMDEAEKERLIKKDMLNIENRVRHVFNQGYEMGLKANKSEIPNTYGDAISREELIEALNTWDKFGYAPTNELIPLRGNVDKDKYVPYIHYDDVIKCIKGTPSVTPQQRTGRWISVSERLPEPYQRCLFIVKKNRWENEPVEYIVIVKAYGGEQDFTAWMPLPEPYKGGKND